MNYTTDKQSDNSWVTVISKYNNPSNSRSWWQLVNTVIPYGMVWVAMALSLSVSYWITLTLSLVGAGLLVRIFIIFHDCGHGSFFKSKVLSDSIGFLLGVLTFTPYFRWHHAHQIHHRTAGNLDKRGVGDVWTLTVQEYLALPKGERLKYRIYRNPYIMFGIGAFLMFVINNRFTRKSFSAAERKSVYYTNLGIAFVVSMFLYFIGWKAYLLIQLPIIYFASTAGVYMFYVQHQFEEVHWSKGKDWDFKTVALKGSSYFKLPVVLQWFTGNIGFHHIHHLSFVVPNYYLEKCHKASPLFSSVKPITLWQSFSTLKLRLYDEESRRMVSFKDLKLVAPK